MEGARPAFSTTSLDSSTPRIDGNTAYGKRFAKRYIRGGNGWHATAMAVATKQFETVPEFARTLRVSRRTVYRAVARGDIAALRLNPNGALRIPSSELERLLDTR